MSVNTKGVKGSGVIISSAIVPVPRGLAESNGAIASAENIEQAKARFTARNLPGATFLIEAVQAQENERSVVGYFGFTIDRRG